MEGDNKSIKGGIFECCTHKVLAYFSQEANRYWFASENSKISENVLNNFFHFEDFNILF